MHTTLDFLKISQACVPGYTRTVSFFGRGNRTQKIPLHAIALVGGQSDAEWALNNGCVIDEEQYKEFYRRHMPSVFKYLCHGNIQTSASRHTSDSRKADCKNKVVADLIKETMTCHTFEECEAMLKKIRSMHFQHNLFSEVANHDCWKSPHEFIAYCLGMMTNTYDPSSSKWAFPEHKEVKKAATRTPSRSRHRDDDDDEDNYDEEEEEAASLSYEAYWIRSTKKHQTAGVNTAYLFSETPFDFMGNLEYKKPAGVKIEKKEGGGITLTAKLDDPEQMFYLLRTMTAKSGFADQDTEPHADEE